MISFLRRYRKPMFVAIIAIFLIGIFVGLGGYLFTSRDTSQAVAQVGAVKIPYSRFVMRVNQWVETLRDQKQEVTDEMVKEVKQSMLRDMIVDEILLMKSEEMGIVVSDEELARDIRNTPAFQRGGVFEQELYFQAVRTVFRDSPQAYEDFRRQTLKTSKLKQIFFNAAKLTPEELRQAYAAQNKGSLKDFEKNRNEFEARAQQQRALELLNYHLRQVAAQLEIRSFLEQRESGT